VLAVIFLSQFLNIFLSLGGCSFLPPLKTPCTLGSIESPVSILIRPCDLNKLLIGPLNLPLLRHNFIIHQPVFYPLLLVEGVLLSQNLP